MTPPGSRGRRTRANARPRVSFLVGLAALLLCACGPRGARPNVILISVDTLRADRLGCYGYGLPTTPNVDRFASEAVLFERCIAHSPNTWGSSGSIMTGFLPQEHKADGWFGLPREVETLAEMLRRDGYFTIGVVSNFVLRSRSGWNQGFEVFDDEMLRFESGRQMPERIAEETTDRAIELIDTRAESPFFLWVHYQDPHGPYTPPEEFVSLLLSEHAETGEHPEVLRLNPNSTGYGGIPDYQAVDAIRDAAVYRARYDAEIRYFDQEFGRLLSKLEQAGYYDDSIVILTADHGEAMGEHGFYFSHGESLYNSLLHVPLIVRFGDGRTGRRPGLVQHLDIPRTLQAMLGLHGDRELPGADLRDPGARSEPIVSSVELWYRTGESADPSSRWVGSIIDGEDKLVFSPPQGRYELYDLETDMAEETDLAADQRSGDRKETLAEALQRSLDRDRLGVAPPEPRELTQGERDSLRSLGYVE